MFWPEFLRQSDLCHKRLIDLGLRKLARTRSEAPKVEWLRSTCTVMGLFEDWRCEIAEVRLAPGHSHLQVRPR
jgi:hypothetical protein